MKKLLLIAIAATGFLAGCNTVAGVGQDIKAGGQAVTNVAHDVKNDM